MLLRFNVGTYGVGRRGFQVAAFTIVELVVVLGIIGILAITLLPALAMSMAKSQQNQCINNLHRFGVAIQLYEGDNQDSLPDPNWNPPWSGAGWLYNAQGGSIPLINKSDPIITYQGGLLWRYIQNVNVYWCPADNTNSPNSSLSRRPNQMSTYLMNGAVAGFYAHDLYPQGNNQPPYKITAISIITGFVLWEPSDISYIYNDGASIPDPFEGAGRFHFPGSNLLGLDGHTEFKSYTTTTNLMSTKGPNEFWWAPDKPNTGGWPDGTGH